MRLGIMGFAHVHADDYAQLLAELENVELVGFSEPDEALGAEAANAYGLRRFPEHEALLDQGLDGVLVCTETARHLRPVQLAAAAGAHVLCEKPLATSLDDAIVMREACEVAGVRFMTAFPMRFDPAARALKAALESGDLGTLYAANGINHSENPMAHRAWFADKALAGGGAAMDHSVHVVDMLRWYTGAEVAEVYAELGNPFSPGLEVDTAGLVSLTFDNGVFVSVDCSWSRPSGYPRWGHLKLELFGERGSLDLDAFAQHLQVYRPGAGRQTEWLGWGTDPTSAMLREFIACIREDRQPVVSWRDGYEATKVALACYTSAARGDVIKPLK